MSRYIHVCTSGRDPSEFRFFKKQAVYTCMHSLLLLTYYRLCCLKLVQIAKQKGGIRPWVGHLDEVLVLEASRSALRNCFILCSYVKE